MNRYFRLAKEVSKKSDYHHKIGAVIVNRKKDIFLGFNKPTKTHPKSEHPFQTIHAELDTILGVDLEKLNGAEIYIYREWKDGTPATAKPCKYCERLLRRVKISVVHYTCSQNRFQKMRLE